ncbi:MAG TPA: hypothetical protein VFN94_05400, partial [Nitrospiria bacterium]|nr:hypothetical protein [Nitrospiria bacterium]
MMRTACWKAVLATVLLLWARGAAAASGLDVRYSITVHFDPTDHTLTGTAEVSVTNHTGMSVPEIPFVLYPNRYREADPDLDVTARERIYPRAFNPGSIAITAAETAAGTPVDMAIDGGAVPPYTIARATLPRAMGPDGVVALRIQFVTFIPEKFGVFGHFQGVTTLKGGWYPYVPPWRDGGWALDVPPDPAFYAVSISAPGVVTIAGAEPVDDGT